jgi:iron(III) transport system permease protein
LRHDAGRTLTVAAAWTVFAVCCVLPIAWMLFGSAGSGSLRASATVLADDRQRSLMVNTLVLGLGVTTFALAVGAPLGIVLARCTPRRAWLARLIFSVPLVLPSYVLGLAWTVLFGAYASAWVYSVPAAIVVLGFALYPIVMLASEAALRAVSARLEEAGHLSASPTRVFVSITLPLIAATVAASLLIVFVLAISDFAVPGLLRVRVYTTEVFTAFAALYDFRLATIVALPLVAVAALASIGVVVVFPPLTPKTHRGESGRRWGDSAQRIALLCMLVVASVTVGLPLAAVALEAQGGRGAYDRLSFVALRNSVVWSATAASLVVAIGTVLGSWRRKAAPRTGRLVDGLWVTLFAVPATIIGIGIIALWNRPSPVGNLYQTGGVVVLAYVSRFLPIGALLCGAFMQRIPAGVEEAAEVAGAAWVRTLMRIVVPMSRDGLAAVWLVMFILMFGDVALAILVSPPGESNLGVRAFTLIANSPSGDVARVALVQIAATVLPLAALAAIMRRQELAR